MNKLSKNEKGFSPVEIILVIVIIALLGVVGYFVYKNRQPAKVVTVTKTVVAPTKATSSSTSSTHSTPAQKYLTITEWGVRAPYSGSDTLSYKFESGSQNSIQVISNNLATNYGCKDYGAGGISRALPTDPADPGSQTIADVAKTNTKDYKYINGYYYLFYHDQAACSDQVSVGSPGEAADSAANTFTESLISKLEPFSSN